MNTNIENVVAKTAIQTFSLQPLTLMMSSELHTVSMHATLSSLHGGFFLPLLLFQAKVFLAVDQHTHGGLGACVPHGAPLIQQAGTDPDVVVARR